MLAALLIAFFLGASGASGAILTESLLKDFDERAQQVLADQARADAVSAELTATGHELKHFNKTFARSGKSLTKLYKDHGRNATGMQAELDQLNAGWEAAQLRAIEHRFSIRELMTPEEWEAVFLNE